MNGKQTIPVPCKTEDRVREERRLAAIDFNGAAAGSPEEANALARYQEATMYIELFD